MQDALQHNHQVFINKIAYGYKPQILQATAQYTPEAQKVKDMILKATKQAKQLTNGENIV